MAIDPAMVLVDVELRLPNTNVLTDDQLTTIINSNIAAIGSDDSYYAEVTCKSLRDAAEINQLKATGDQSLRSRKIEDIVEEEYFENALKNAWDEYINLLPTTCARLGYTGLGAIQSGYINVFTSTTETVDDDRFIDVNILDDNSEIYL